MTLSRITISRTTMFAGAFLLAALFAFAILAPEAIAQSTAERVRDGCELTGTCTGGEGDLSGIIGTVVDILSIIVGAVSVIMIIIGGLRYITSGGDSGKVASAKNTIIYAVVGLVIVLFAQVIVNYVITETTT